jgi:dephospho-CoA kinase
MLKVAVTGNIGSGKTTICRFFALLGIPVFYSDVVAKNLYNDPVILGMMVEQFGKQILTEANALDTKVFASIIFNDKNALSFVTSIIHPAVFKLFHQWCNSHKNKPWCIQESALVFETGNDKNFDRIILVYAPEDILIQRVTKRDGSSPEDVANRLNHQIPVEAKLKLAHYQILNDNSQLIIPQLLHIHEELSTHRSDAPR